MAICCAGEASLYAASEEGLRKRKGLVRLKGKKPYLRRPQDPWRASFLLGPAGENGALGPVRDAFRASHASAVGAAVEVAVRLDAVSDHPDPAILTRRGEGVDRTLEAVEGVRVATCYRDGERLVVPYTTHRRPDAQSYCREIDV